MSAFNSAQTNPDLPQVTDVSPEEVWEKREKLCLVDVRRPDEYNGELGHVPGSQLLTLDQLGEKLKDIPQDQDVVFICRSGARSGRATYFASENGYTRVYNMKGGMIAWNEKALPVER